jgi:D-amino-acid dehydrogenase
LRAGFLPGGLPWLLRFLLAMRRREVMRAAGAIHAMTVGSQDGYRRLLGPAAFADLVRPVGQLYVFEREVPSTGETEQRLLREAFGVRMEAIPQQELRQLEPALAPTFRRGLLFPDYAHTVDPARLTRTLVNALQQAGGSFQRGEVSRIARSGAGVGGVETSGGLLAAERVVIAAGIASRALARGFELTVPLVSERGYHVMLPSPTVQPRRPIADVARAVIATPMEQGLRFAGTVELAAPSAPPDPARAQVLARLAQQMFPGLASATPSTWLGNRPSFPDSVPMIGLVPGAPSLAFAFGHGHLGLTGAPFTARLLADLFAKRAPGIDPAPYRVDRFRGIA